MASNQASQYDAPDLTFTYAEVADNLNLAADTLHRLSRRFAAYLGFQAKDADRPRFTSSDIATLITIQKLLAQGYDDEQIGRRLHPDLPGEKGEKGNLDTPMALITTTVTTDTGRSSERKADASRIGGQKRHEPPAEMAAQDTVSNVLDTIASSQKAVLNGQSTLRDVVGVVVQDNFNLKDENRKLRERMLELERALAEYQRREENRKERIESRTRALESTVAALQQQVAQIVQLHRQQRRRRGLFG